MIGKNITKIFFVPFEFMVIKKQNYTKNIGVGVEMIH